MTPPAKVLLIALDACDHKLVRSMAAAGELPTLANLLDNGAVAPSVNPYGLYVGTIWPTAITGRKAARNHLHCWEEIDVETYELRPTSAADIDGDPFWEQISAADRRVAAVDVPHSNARAAVDGVVVVEYGCHDRHFGFHTYPPELAQQIESQYGLHPVLTADPYVERQWAPDDYLFREGALRTDDEERLLLAAMLDGLDRKTRLTKDLLAQGGWDLFTVVFGESHSIGHQSWHVHDPKHPRHDPRLRADLGDPIAEVYRRLDSALSELLAVAGPDASVFVLLSHGMGPHFDGGHLLHEITRRLDKAADGDGAAGRSVMNTAKRSYARVPGSLRRVVTPAAMRVLQRRLARHPLPPVNDWSSAELRAAQRFYLSPNNTAFGGIRINLIGREPQGKVAPGAEFDAVCAQLCDDLMALVNVDTGRPVVRRVSRTDEHYERESTDTLPDLLIDWARDAPVETIWSPKTGVIYRPYIHWRTGDHTEQGLLLAHGPGFARGPMPPVDIIDLGASLAARLGVPLSGDVDGRPVVWIANPPVPVPTG